MTTKIKSGVIGDGVVGTTQIADDAITSAKIPDDAVTGAKIENAVTIATSVTSPLIDGQNFKINGGQGTDGQLLTSTGSGVAWEDAPAGGPTFKTFGTASLMIGSNSTGTINAADYNTAVSTTAFAALTSGDFNVAFGEQALDALTTGGGNTALGVSTLGALTTASNNTAVGISALTSNTDGTVNTAVGSDAMAANTEGYQNTAVGSLALDANTTGIRNVALGYLALSANTTAGYQTAIGYNSLVTVNGGLENTALGANTLSTNSTGSYNVGIGANALYANTTASYNTAVGHGACSLNRTGNKLASLGYEAEKNNENGYDNVSIGYQANSTSAGAGNGVGRITIGTSVTGYGQEWVTFGRTNSTRTRVALGTTTWYSDSDERLKENIQTSAAGLSFINDLRPVTFDWKKKGEIDPSLTAYKEGSEDRIKFEDNLNRYGFIAQEVKQAIDNHPEVLDNGEIWQEDEMDGTQGVAPTALIPMLVKAMQELKTELDAAKARITTLEG